MVDKASLSEVLSEFASTMLSDFRIQSILDRLVRRIVDVLDVTGAGVTLIDVDSVPRYVAASDATALLFEQLQSEMGQGPCLTAYTSGQPVAVTDPARDPRYPLFGPAAVAQGLAAVFTFPLRQGDGRLGALDLYRSTPGDLSVDDVAAAQTLADVAAAYLLNAQARERVLTQAEVFRHSALHDSLTGLANRALLQERLGHLAARAKRSHGLCAVVFVDLDRFKRINDVHGHAVGDQVLVAVAKRLLALVRPGDTLARISGDEFVFLLEDLVHDSDVESLAERIGHALRLPFALGGAELRISASVGVAYCGPGEAVTPELLSDADAAMYAAKRTGGGQHHVLHLSATRSPGPPDLQQELHQALADNALAVAYQPIVRLGDGVVVGVEALLRWTHPISGPVPALTAIALAEQSGLIDELGQWVLRRACLDHRGWMETSCRDSGEPAPMLSVNVSVRQLMERDFVQSTLAVLTETGMDPTLLVLEITETVFIEDGVRAATVLGGLRSAGIRVALDDFGTGYSSLSYLSRFPVDIIKIDQCFVAEVARDTSAKAIITAVVTLAQILGLVVIAEGVESRAQFDELVLLGCDLTQGFWLNPALPASAVGPLLRRAARGWVARGPGAA